MKKKAGAINQKNQESHTENREETLAVKGNKISNGKKRLALLIYLLAK